MTFSVSKGIKNIQGQKLKFKFNVSWFLKKVLFLSGIEMPFTGKELAFKH